MPISSAGAPAAALAYMASPLRAVRPPGGRIEHLLGTDEHPFGRSFRPLSAREAEDIAAMGDPVRRNLRITQGYHDLVLSMTWLLGSRNVSWCAFATWASQTAGRFIRGERLLEMVRDCLDRLASVHEGMRRTQHLLMRRGHDVVVTRSLLITALERMCQHFRERVALGNRIVFAEIAPLFARMIERFRGATTYDHHAIRRFLSSFRPGPTTEGGQDLLIAAFGNYYKAMFETHPKKKAELILLANDQVGYHEQTRLQEPVFDALNTYLARTFLHPAHEHARELIPRGVRGRLGDAVDRALRSLAAWLQQEWSAMATRWLVRLELPTSSLCLARDLPGACATSMFPEELATIDNDTLAALLYRLDFTPNTLRGSAAHDWSALADRMNYVVDLFRAHQQDHSLYRHPFTHEQVEVIRASGIPGGDL